MRIHFVLLVSFVMPLSSLSKAQVKPLVNSQALIMATVSLEILRRASENLFYSNPVIFDPAINNVFRLLRHAARHQTRAEIDELRIEHQQEDSLDASGIRPVTHNGAMLIAAGWNVQINNRFRNFLVRLPPPPHYRQRLADRRFSDVLQGFSVYRVPSFTDLNTFEPADADNVLHIISAVRIDRPLAEAFDSHPEALTSLSTTTPEDMQALASEHQRDSRVSNSQIASHLDLTERLRHLMPTAFSPQADFRDFLAVDDRQVSLRRVVQGNDFRTSGDTASVISTTRFTFHVSPVTAYSSLPNLVLTHLRRVYQTLRESILIPEEGSQPPPAVDVPPLLFGVLEDSPHRPGPFQRLDLREDGSFSMIRRPGLSFLENFRVSGTWELVPCYYLSQYRIHFSNIQNSAVTMPDHAFEDISVNFNLVDRVTVLDVDSFNRAEKNGEHEIYTYYSSIVFKQNPVEMVYQQHPNAQPDDANNDKKTFYPLSGQIKGYCKFLPKDQGN